MIISAYIWLKHFLASLPSKFYLTFNTNNLFPLLSFRLYEAGFFYFLTNSSLKLFTLKLAASPEITNDVDPETRVMLSADSDTNIDKTTQKHDHSYRHHLLVHLAHIPLLTKTYSSFFSHFLLRLKILSAPAHIPFPAPPL